MGDRDIICALIEQVTLAVPSGGSERNVVTVISRPMWQAFMIALGDNPHAEPTCWAPDSTCRRVYGSETHVVESDRMFSFSRAL